MCGVVPSLLSRFKDVKKEKRRTRKLSRDFYARKPKPAFLGHSSVSSSSKDSSLFRTKEKEGNPFTKRGATLVRFSRRRTRSGKDAFGEGTRAPRKARTGTRGRGSEKRASERGRLRGGGEKRKKFLFDLGEIFKETLRQEEEKTKPDDDDDDPKGRKRRGQKRRKERRTHGVQRDRRDAKRRAMADVAKRRRYSPTENLDSTHVSARRASPRARLRGRWIFVFCFFVVCDDLKGESPDRQRVSAVSNIYARAF